MSRITINILPDGKIETDFSGYEGDTCLNEAERLNVILKSLGVGITSKTVTRKASEKQAIALRNRNPSR